MLTDPPLSEDLTDLEERVRATGLPPAPNDAADLEAPPRNTVARRPRVIETCALLVYLASLSYGVAIHTPWADEIQSWLLARDLSPIGLAAHQLRYEGSPGLWQLVLYPFAHLGLPVLTLNIVGASISAIGVALLIYVSPLPLVLRLVLPFTYFVLFQYAVLSRPYNLLIPLLFVLASLYPRRFDRSFLYTAVLCLASAISVQMMLVAGVLFIILLSETARRSADRTDLARRIMAPLSLFFLVECALVTILWPTSDNAFVFASHLVTNPAAVLHGIIIATFSSSFVGVPLANGLILVVICTWLYSRGVLAAFLGPFVAVVLFCAIKADDPWFHGFDSLLLIFALWIGYASPTRRATVLAQGQVLARMCLLAVVAVASVQACWSAFALNWSASHAYGAGEQAASFLAAHHLSHDVIATDGEYWPIDVEPYLPSGQFANLPQPGAYYHWSKANDFNSRLFEPLIDRAAQVLVTSPSGLNGRFTLGDNPSARPKFAGYRVVAEFRGETFWPITSAVQHQDLLIYLRNDLTLSSAER